MMQYEPEIGQALFGQPYKALELSDEAESALDSIRGFLYLTLGKRKYKDICGDGYHEVAEGDPFGNSGGEFKNSVFHIQAYLWDDDVDQPYNFKWRDFEVSWYKYLGRGSSMNRDISNGELFTMVKECINSVQEAE